MFIDSNMLSCPLADGIQMIYKWTTRLVARCWFWFEKGGKNRQIEDKCPKF